MTISNTNFKSSEFKRTPIAFRFCAMSKTRDILNVSVSSGKNPCNSMNKAIKSNDDQLTDIASTAGITTLDISMTLSDFRVNETSSGDDIAKVTKRNCFYNHLL
ncbi:hypothetical protein RF11_13231 [Thelohanellus kitauei]|uniref:Uncharacterized protein n=1 Tax=Thelohanellus kitauei TaxID=669202 RepID=A0A0C2M4D1_THEKT|nr:hypothetical protein RF11_13231 [Thelohanellus kitauei]